MSISRSERDGPSAIALVARVLPSNTMLAHNSRISLVGVRFWNPFMIRVRRLRTCGHHQCLSGELNTWLRIARTSGGTCRFFCKFVKLAPILLGHPYGTDFVYDEMMVAPGFGEIARVTTETFTTMVSLFGTGGLKPGAGPTREEREKGFYDILFLGELPNGGRVEAVVTGDRDPGYGSTSKMIAE